MTYRRGSYRLRALAFRARKRRRLPRLAAALSGAASDAGMVDDMSETLNPDFHCHVYYYKVQDSVVDWSQFSHAHPGGQDKPHDHPFFDAYELCIAGRANATPWRIVGALPDQRAS